MAQNLGMASSSKPRSRSADPPVGLRERKKAKTKAAIQHHALRLFRSQGYAATTVEQIAEAAEVSPSTFFRYFATKEDVVLADFIDHETFARMVNAPKDLSPLEALLHAVRQTFGEMSEEDVRLEMMRNELIQSVPELRRGMLLEMTRPMALLGEAIATRLGRPPDDPDVAMYAAAAIGGMMTLTSQIDSDDPGRMVALLEDAVTRLGRMLTLP
jgi:AcrR family transcriptional regulator